MRAARPVVGLVSQPCVHIRAVRASRKVVVAPSVQPARLIAAMGVGSSKAGGLGVKLPGEDHSKCIYLDYNATTPIFPEVAVEMEPFLWHHFGNPSSAHIFGAPCADAVKLARARLATLLGCKTAEIVFTACGSESDNFAVVGVLSATREALKGGLPHVVTTNIEHPAITECLSALAREGRLSYTEVPVDHEGLITAQQVQQAMTENTVLVTVMHSNNEIGTLLPIAEIAKVAHKHGAVMHTDAAQSIGKVPVKAAEHGADLVTVVGHKFGAPKGVAALYVREGTRIARMIHGGGQEMGRRAGTENVLLIAGLGRAAELAESEAAATTAHLKDMRDMLQALLMDRCKAKNIEVRVNGPSDDDKRLPNTLSISIKGLKASQLLQEVSSTLAASAGSACHSGADTVSSVLKAIKLPVEYAVGTLRLSTGRHTTKDDIERAADIIMSAVERQELGSIK